MITIVGENETVIAGDVISDRLEYSILGGKVHTTIESLTLKNCTIASLAFLDAEFPNLYDLTFDNVFVESYGFSGVAPYGEHKGSKGIQMPKLKRLRIQNNLEIMPHAFGVVGSEIIFWDEANSDLPERSFAPDLGMPDVIIAPNTTVKWGARHIGPIDTAPKCATCVEHVQMVNAIFKPLIKIADGWNTKFFIPGLSISWASETYIYYACENLIGALTYPSLLATEVKNYYSTHYMEQDKILCDKKTKIDDTCGFEPLKIEALKIELPKVESAESNGRQTDVIIKYVKFLSIRMGASNEFGN